MIAEERSEILPRSIKIVELVSSRYNDNNRPDSWDLRIAGIDVAKADDQKQYFLLSDGQQSPPKAGNTIILRQMHKVEGAEAYSWTLYGI